MMSTPARFAKHSLCICGFPALNESIMIGTAYQIDENNRCMIGFICGGCGMHYSGVECVWVEQRGESAAGYLPLELFETEDQGYGNVR